MTKGDSSKNKPVANKGKQPAKKSPSLTRKINDGAVKLLKVVQYCFIAVVMLLASDIISSLGYYYGPPLINSNQVELPANLIDQNDTLEEKESKAAQYLKEENEEYPTSASVALEDGSSLRVYAPASNQQTLLIYGFSRLILIGFIILYLKSTREKLSSLGVTEKNIETAWYAIPAYFAYLLSIFAVMYVVGFYVSQDILTQEQSIGFEDTNDFTGTISAFIALVIIAPIAEELLFRGYLFNRLKTAIDYRWAILISSLIFGLVHIQPNVAIDTFVLAIYLGLLLYRTQNIAASVLLHMIKNGVAFYFLFLF